MLVLHFNIVELNIRAKYLARPIYFDIVERAFKKEVIKYHLFNIFSFLTRYFGDPPRLMLKKSKLVVYIFVASCPFFQINAVGYAL